MVTADGRVAKGVTGTLGAGSVGWAALVAVEWPLEEVERMSGPLSFGGSTVQGRAVT